jgi:hypothetical protein
MGGGGGGGGAYGQTFYVRSVPCTVPPAPVWMSDVHKPRIRFQIRQQYKIEITPSLPGGRGGNELGKGV